MQAAIDALSLEPGGFRARIAEHIEWMLVRNYALSTTARTERELVEFATWAEERGIVQPGQVTRQALERYAAHLYEHHTALGVPLSTHAQYARLSALRVFYRNLARKSLILYSPANDLELPRLTIRLPKAVLTHVEMERVLSQPDIETKSGIRDRAILETLYSTGIRRTELTELELPDLDLARGTAMIRQGKGRRDRFVPIGRRAQDWIELYLHEVRPSYATQRSPARLYLTAYGEPLSPGSLSHRVTEYVKAAGIEKAGSCHLFRHTMATQMLEHGADVRVIQEILGHRKLDTTNIYTRVSIGHLKEVHDRTHPAAQRGPLEPRETADESEETR